MGSHGSPEGFGSSTIILRSKARPEVSYRRGRRRSVAMPAFAWEVVVDVRERRGLHPLQRAVLGLMRCGVVEAEDLAHHLALLVPLIETVVQELVGMRLVDAKGILTKRGEERLEDDAMLPEIRFVFSDPWSGQLWPRIVSRLDAAETVPGSEDAQFPALEMGTLGRPRTVKPFYVRSPMRHKLDSTIPVPAGVARAIRRHTQAAELFSREQVPQFGKVRHVSRRPIPVYLVADVYVPEAEEFDENWRVACPFGLGDLPWLRRHLDARRKGDPADGGVDLARVMSSLYDSGAPPTSRQALEVRIEERLTTRILSFPTILDGVMDLEATRLALVGGMDARQKRRMVANAAREAGTILETVLGSLAAQGEHGLDQRLRAEGRLLGLTKVLDHARQALGQNRLPRNWRDLGGQRLRIKTDSPPGLDDLLRVTVLVAASRQTHPLRDVFLADPEILGALQLTRQWRNQHSHGNQPGSTSRRRWDDEELNRCIDAVFTVVEAALSAIGPED